MNAPKHFWNGFQWPCERGVQDVLERHKAVFGQELGCVKGIHSQVACWPPTNVFARLAWCITLSRSCNIQWLKESLSAVCWLDRDNRACHQTRWISEDLWKLQDPYPIPWTKICLHPWLEESCFPSWIWLMSTSKFLWKMPPSNWQSSTITKCLFRTTGCHLEFHLSQQFSKRRWRAFSRALNISPCTLTTSLSYS